MSRRPTTAEILAAARGAPARTAAASPPLHNDLPAADGSTAAMESFATANGNHAPPRAPAAPAEAESAASDRPASMTAILRDVRSGRDSPMDPAANVVPEEPVAPIVPPSVRKILQRLRPSPSANASNVPPSMAAVLAMIRGGNDAIEGGTSVAGPSMRELATSPTTAVARKGRPSTAEILAAARTKAAGQQAGQATGATSQPSRSTPAAASSSVAPSTAASRTSSILEAARRQGGVGGTAAAGTTAPARPSKKKPVAAATPRPVSSADAGRQGEDGPRPVSMVSVLAAVRGELPLDESTVVYPSLPEMLAELRRQEERRRGALRAENNAKSEAPGVVSSLVAWWRRKRDTHHGASI